jgi:hypothetical protein
MFLFNCTIEVSSKFGEWYAYKLKKNILGQQINKINFEIIKSMSIFEI